MGKATILLAAVVLALSVGGGAALAATIRCDGGDCFGTNRVDTMYGTKRHDAIFARAGGDIVFGRERGDNLNGQDGNDRVFGGRGDDRVKGGDRDDVVKGADGHDTLTGGSGDNVIRAGDGMRDRIICGNNSWNFIYYDPGLDRFDNCEFEKSDGQRSTGGSSATTIAFGPGREAK